MCDIGRWQRNIGGGGAGDDGGVDTSGAAIESSRGFYKKGHICRRWKISACAKNQNAFIQWLTVSLNQVQSASTEQVHEIYKL